uniref:WRKY transcription factor 33 n=1 Tax=Capsella rubella TaxID=81985 RepID=Q7X7K9_9BRAS|nr:WRKY transcription factor 33 [Capsella rubella]AAP82933.1 WRKY transcription factor 33 [Capsella rubella]
MDNSRTRQNMNGSAAATNWSQQNGRTSTSSLEDLEIPKFRSFAPSSISISPSLVSPSTCFSPSVFLDSPAFVSSSAHVLASPTTGALITNESNTKLINEGEKKDNNINFFDFSFQTQSSGVSAPTTTTTTTNNSSIFQSQEQQRKNQSDQWSQNESRQNNQAVSYNGREQRKGEDGYNWRKYGQKQVKGSENPRSYYKCTFPSCPTKKKVERSLEGQITEIVYKGSHNHPKPQSTRRSSSSSSSTFHSAVYNASLDHHRQASSDQPNSNNSFHHSDSFAMQQDDNTTSDSVGDDEFEQGSSIVSRDEEDCGSEPEAKRWKGENETNGGNGGGSKTGREPRIVVQTTSDIDILDDGYRWRKYGQKVVKGNPNPRSYYKCTTIGCPVRKHVERASHDMRAVITTYEGKHNHDVPAARGSGYATNRAPQDASSVPIRPAAIAGHSNSTTSSPAPYTLQTLHNNNTNSTARSWLRYDNNNNNNNNNPQTLQNCVCGDAFSRATEEPNEETSFFDSFMP